MEVYDVGAGIPPVLPIHWQRSILPACRSPARRAFSPPTWRPTSATCASGAAYGAAAGVIAGRRRGKAAEKKAEEQVKQQSQQAEQATAEQMGNFKKAFSVCLEAKKYMVKF